MKSLKIAGLILGVISLFGIVGFVGTRNMQAVWTNPAMSVGAYQISVSSYSPTSIAIPTFGNVHNVRIRNLDPMYAVFIGTSTSVTRTSGYKIFCTSFTTTSQLELSTNQPLYGITESTTGTTAISLLLSSWE